MLIEKIESIHIELTNRCNAACPQCSRTFNESIKNDVQEITLKNFKEWFSPELLQSMVKIKFCGNFGDPAIAKDCLGIHQYVLDSNPDIQFLMNTNGGVRTTTFWTKLGEIYAKSPKSNLTFHIDGLEDTNHIYRQGVVWKKLMNNVKSFLDTGANAVWAFIPFFHNEHQVEEAEQMSKDMKFKGFGLKISARWNNRSKPFSYEGGKLYPPTSCEFNIDGFQRFEESPKCVAQSRGEMYIDAWGRLLPCCWIGSSVQKSGTEITGTSLHEYDINTIMNNDYYSHELEESWTEKRKSPVCHRRCTGSQVHVWEIDGIKKPQKDLWYDEQEMYD